MALNRLVLVLTVFFVTGLGPEAFAIKDKSLYFGLGLFSHGIEQVSQDSSANPGILGTLYFPFVAQTSFNLGAQWHLAPSLGYTVLGTYLFPKTAPDGGSKTSYFFLSLPFVDNYEEGSSGFEWEVGPSFLLYTVSGSGGSTVLNNGAGFQTFALPGNSQSAWTLALLVGLGYDFEDFRVTLDTVTEGLFSSRRTFSLMLNLTYNVLGGTRF